MGCGNAKKDFENQMMIFQLERANIQMERVNNLKLLEEIDGYKRQTNNIPDYIEPGFDKEKNKLMKNEISPLVKGGNEIKSSKKRTKRKTMVPRGRKSKKLTYNGNND